MAFSWKHVVPWTNRSEFVRVYEDLYSSDVERQKSAVEEVAVWKSRAMHKLSVAVESTAALTDAFLQHHRALDADNLVEEDQKLRALFSLALIRFVNHITEKGQNKPFAQPVHRIAQEFGIPDWIVRLRHDATHGSLPCLDVLTTGARWAVNYLREEFWSQQVVDTALAPPSTKRVKGKGVVGEQRPPVDVDNILRTYRKASHRVFSHNSTVLPQPLTSTSLSEGPEGEAGREEGRALRQTEAILSSHRRNSMLVCLVEPDHLLSSDPQLQAYQVNLHDTVYTDPPRVPEVLVSIWRPMLRLVHSRHLTPLLLQHLLKSLLSHPDPNALHARLAAAWIRLILLYDTSNFEGSEAERGGYPELYRSSIDINKDLLLATCLHTPTSLTLSLLPLMGTVRALPTNTQSRLAQLEHIYTGGAHSQVKGEASRQEAEGDERQRDSTKIFSVTDLQGVQTAEDDENSSTWQLCTDAVDWERVAWGLLPGHTIADTCLDCGDEDDADDAAGSWDEDRGSEDSEVAGDDGDRLVESVGWREELVSKIEVD